MKKTNLILALIMMSSAVFAQKKMTSSGIVTFDASTSIDALPKAENKTVVAAIDPKTGAVQFEAIVKSFTFSNSMMQDHFNGENWMNSDKFPTSTFKGKLTNLAAVNFKKDGTYPAEVTGDLTIHGITKPATSKGTIVVSGKSIAATSNFNIKLEDYGITSKAIEGGKVAKEPIITVSVEFK